VSTAPENKVRKDLVQVFFGLVLTQIAIYATSLIGIHFNDLSWLCAAWTHLILALSLTAASWFGWQMAVKNATFDDEASIFQGSFVLSVLDIVLVGLYFLLVHQVEMDNVTAFPSVDKPPKLIRPSASPESWTILIIFGIYAVWDSASQRIDKKPYGPWPSLLCVILVIGATLVSGRAAIEPGWLAVWCDTYLLGVVVLFRALKRLQKWAVRERKDNPTTSYFKAPKGIWVWIVICGCVIVAAGIVAVFFLPPGK